ncbi:MAG TPA: CinA family protein [Candidatus Corynebacterium gallistercoris]|uniref:CinA family protein n=1 Tax=Candidatus Corynebacterium gallistercoris TaxID=2838530 RepID=A0A9D1UQJ2_9CORY|nr:CinA family protein [Candidatus Corynebacterium gallistercoris]
MSHSSQPLGELARDVIAALRTAGETVAFAESLTAGLCTAALADVPGASAVLRGGLVVYATDLKARLAGVDQVLLDTRGAVDPEVARQLAAGAARACGADWGVGLTGVAGPDPQDGHPVGEVYVALRSDSCHAVRRLDLGEKCDGDGVDRRRCIREAAVSSAFSWLLQRVNQ